MKNFQYLLAAWIAVWVVFFFYQVSLSRRFSQLFDEVKRLKEISGVRGQLVSSRFHMYRGIRHLCPLQRKATSSLVGAARPRIQKARRMYARSRTESPVRTSSTEQSAGIHAHRRFELGAGHRCNYRHLLSRGSRPASPASL